MVKIVNAIEKQLNQNSKKDIYSEKTYRRPKDTWKDAQHCLLLKKCKSKLQWAVTAVRIVSIKMVANNSGENVKKTTESILSSNSTPGHISGKDENFNSKQTNKKNIYPSVHSSTIYNSQDVEAT